jgi:hypothetical protein
MSDANGSIRNLEMARRMTAVEDRSEVPRLNQPSEFLERIVRIHQPQSTPIIASARISLSKSEAWGGGIIA